MINFVYREGDVSGGSGKAGQHSGEEGKEEGQGEADAGGKEAGLSAEEERNESSWTSVSAKGERDGGKERGEGERESRAWREMLALLLQKEL